MSTQAGIIDARMNADSRIYVAGHRGLVGGAIVRKLRDEGFNNLILKTRAEVDLTRQAEVEAFYAAEKPEFVFAAAAKVGGIHANNSAPADFLFDNLAIQNNLIDGAYRSGVTKLLFLGSSCIYPRECPQPMKEEYLLTGPLEPTNEWYAVAKIAGMKMCQAYRRQYGFNAVSLMPTNLYGPGDNFDLQTSHVLAALIRKFSEAVESGAEAVEIWGTGTPRREFLHVDDLASAAFFVMQNYDDEAFLNVGTGRDISIGGLAELLKEIAGFDGELQYDRSKPDGTPQKLLDVSRLGALGWAPEIELKVGLAATLDWFRDLRLD